jgi:hypothetical protein
LLLCLSQHSGCTYFKPGVHGCVWITGCQQTADTNKNQ